MSDGAYARVSRSAGRLGAEAYISERRRSLGLSGAGPWVAAVGGGEPKAQGDTGPAPWSLSRTCTSTWGASQPMRSAILKPEGRRPVPAKRAAT